VFEHLDMSPATRQALNPGITWWGWQVPTLVEAGVIVVLGLAMLGVAIWEFSSTD
jgi:ABC-2 type transport system permease protein